MWERDLVLPMSLSLSLSPGVPVVETHVPNGHMALQEVGWGLKMGVEPAWRLTLHSTFTSSQGLRLRPGLSDPFSSHL